MLELQMLVCNAIGKELVDSSALRADIHLLSFLFGKDDVHRGRIAQTGCTVRLTTMEHSLISAHVIARNIVYHQHSTYRGGYHSLAVGHRIDAPYLFHLLPHAFDKVCERMEYGMLSLRIRTHKYAFAIRRYPHSALLVELDVIDILTRNVGKWHLLHLVRGCGLLVEAEQSVRLCSDP